MSISYFCFCPALLRKVVHELFCESALRSLLGESSTNGTGAAAAGGSSSSGGVAGLGAAGTSVRSPYLADTASGAAPALERGRGVARPPLPKGPPPAAEIEKLKKGAITF